MKWIRSRYRVSLLMALLLILIYLLGGFERTRNVVDIKEADRDDEVLVSVTRDGKIYLGDEARRSETEIRVRNASQVDLSDVVIDGEKFGDLKRDAITEYRKAKLAHRYPSASLSANSKPLEAQLVDDGSHIDLRYGRFTYVITIEGGHLYVQAEKDKD